MHKDDNQKPTANARVACRPTHRIIRQFASAGFAAAMPAAATAETAALPLSSLRLKGGAA